MCKNLLIFILLHTQNMTTNYLFNEKSCAYKVKLYYNATLILFTFFASLGQWKLKEKKFIFQMCLIIIFIIFCLILIFYAVQRHLSVFLELFIMVIPFLKS